jgi:hypothetical protein
MSAGPDVETRAGAPEHTAEGANFAVEPHEQIFQQAMERMAAITDEWSRVVRSVTPGA